MWIDHLFCNEQSSHTRSDIFCFVVTHPSMADAKNSPSPEILYPEWQNEYQVVLLELDRKKLLERVKAAETAIFNRLLYRIAQTPMLNGRPSKMLWRASAFSRGTILGFLIGKRSKNHAAIS